MVIDLRPFAGLIGRLFWSKRHMERDLNSNLGLIMVSGRQFMSCTNLASKCNQAERIIAVV